MKLSMVIAVYNEEENIEELTNRIYDSVKVPFELIYVIDGDDNSINIAKNICRIKDNMCISYSRALRGFANSFIKGFSMVSEDVTHILTLDADLNHQPEEINNLISEMNEKDCDIVIGSRYLKEGKVEELALWKRGISILANFIIKIIWNLKVKDKTSGYRLYKREVIDKIVPMCKSTNFEFLLEILILASKNGYVLSEVPIVFKARTRGESKFELFKVIKGYIKLMWRDLIK